ncbi:hypothetical protein NL676_029049 [Syzygium grande]|nr:hypothetical protein NL676_029049 [Syzygium grande]
MAKHEDRPIPVYSELEPVYGDGSQPEEARLRFDRVKGQVRRGPRSSSSRICSISSYFGVPGRMNLIGEHIDCEGYSVLPMAIRQDTMVFIRKYDSGEPKPLLRIGNVNDKYTMCGYPADPEQALDFQALQHLFVLLQLLLWQFLGQTFPRKKLLD